MPNKAVFKVGRPSVWSQYTSYVSVSGLHSENSPRSLAKNNNIEKQYNDELSIMENMHKKELQNFAKSKKELEQSMLAYSEKMSQINRDRCSLPVLPSLQLTKYWSAGSKNDIRRSVSSEKIGSFERDSSLRSHVEETRETTPIQLSPVVLRTSRRKMTYHGSEGHSSNLEKVVRPRVHSVSSTNPSTQMGEKRQRKQYVISPPSPESYRKLRLRHDSDDSAHENRSVFGDDYSLNSDHSVTSRSCVQISPFPEIAEIPPLVLKETDEKVDINRIIGKERQQKEVKKYRKSVSDLPEPRQSSRLLPMRKSPINSPRKFSHPVGNPSLRKHSVSIDIKKIEEKRPGPGVCQSFQYSKAMEELLKSPNPFTASKTRAVPKVEKGPDGRLIATLGASVLTVIDIDEMHNLRGMRFKIKQKTNLDSNARTQSGDENSDKIDILDSEQLEKTDEGSENVHTEDEGYTSEHNEDVTESNTADYLDSYIEPAIPKLTQHSTSSLTLISVEG